MGCKRGNLNGAQSVRKDKFLGRPTPFSKFSSSGYQLQFLMPFPGPRLLANTRGEADGLRTTGQIEPKHDPPVGNKTIQFTGRSRTDPDRVKR
jgi:hypothetical protein